MSPDPLDTALVAQLQPVRRETAGHRSLFRMFLPERELLRDANVPRLQDLFQKSSLYSTAIQIKTTVNLDDNILRAARVRAAETGETLASFIENALREHLAAMSHQRTDFGLNLLVKRGRPVPGVTLDDRDPLYEKTENRD